jgi:hypothetical protein
VVERGCKRVEGRGRVGWGRVRVCERERERRERERNRKGWWVGGRMRFARAFLVYMNYHLLHCYSVLLLARTG